MNGPFFNDVSCLSRFVFRKARKTSQIIPRSPSIHENRTNLHVVLRANLLAQAMPCSGLSPKQNLTSK
jgi:hypothetical protein